MTLPELRLATTYPAIVGHVLASHRSRIPATQGDIARKLGLSPSTWSRVERGEVGLTMDQLSAAASVLGVEPGQILARADHVSQTLAARGVNVERQRLRRPIDSGLALVAGVVLGALVTSLFSGEETE